MNLTSDNTAIVLDSTSDFPGAVTRFPNMRIVPLYVNFGSESFKDLVDITPDEFYRRLKAAPALPTTSQPTPQDFLEVFEELGAYERIFSLQLSSALVGDVPVGDGRSRGGGRRPRSGGRYARPRLSPSGFSHWRSRGASRGERRMRRSER